MPIHTYGVYFIFKSMEQGPSFRVSVPKYATKDPNYRILARQRSRFTHYYFYPRDETLGPMMMRGPDACSFSRAARAGSIAWAMKPSGWGNGEARRNMR